MRHESAAEWPSRKHLESQHKFDVAQAYAGSVLETVYARSLKTVAVRERQTPEWQDLNRTGASNAGKVTITWLDMREMHDATIPCVREFGVVLVSNDANNLVKR